MNQGVPGVIIGVVRDLDDPDKMGRIKLFLPELNIVSDWAWIVTPMAGKDRGLQFMPELDDTALVTFHGTDVTKPYVLGYLWQGDHARPQSEPNKRTIKTASGHVLEFDDSEGSEKITLKLSDGSSSIELSASGIKLKGKLIELN